MTQIMALDVEILDSGIAWSSNSVWIRLTALRMQDVNCSHYNTGLTFTRISAYLSNPYQI